MDIMYRAGFLVSMLWIPASAGMTTKNGKKGKVSRVLDSIFRIGWLQEWEMGFGFLTE